MVENLNSFYEEQGVVRLDNGKVRRMPLADSAPEFEAVRARCSHAAVVAARPTGFVTS